VPRLSTTPALDRHEPEDGRREGQQCSDKHVRGFRAWRRSPPLETAEARR
jgi:hypothetical protein